DHTVAGRYLYTFHSVLYTDKYHAVFVDARSLGHHAVANGKREAAQVRFQPSAAILILNDQTQAVAISAIGNVIRPQVEFDVRNINIAKLVSWEIQSTNGAIG